MRHCLKQEQRLFELVIEHFCLELPQLAQGLAHKHAAMKVSDVAHSRAEYSNTVFTIYQVQNASFALFQLLQIASCPNLWHLVKIFCEQGAQVITPGEWQ